MMKLLSLLTWLITGLSAVNEGAKLFGYDFYALGFMQSHPQAALYTHYVVGAAGVFSILMLLHACVSSVCGCCKKDNCRVACPKCGKTPCVCPHMGSHHNRI